MNVVILSYEIHKVTHTPHVMALLVLTEQEYNVTLETECVSVRQLPMPGLRFQPCHMSDSPGRVIQPLRTQSAQL